MNQQDVYASVSLRSALLGKGKKWKAGLAKRPSRLSEAMPNSQVRMLFRLPPARGVGAGPLHPIPSSTSWIQLLACWGVTRVRWLPSKGASQRERTRGQGLCAHSWP